MPEGVCPKCGFVCYGWFLQNLGEQTCDKCGTKLVIIDSSPKPLTIKPQGGP